MDLDASEENASLSEEQKKVLLEELHRTEQNMASIAIHRRLFDTAEGHRRRCLVYSIRYELEEGMKISMVSDALRTYCSLRGLQRNLLDAVTFTEEAYIPRNVITWWRRLIIVFILKCIKLLEN